MRHVGKATARVTDATEQKPHASRFKRKTPLLSKFKKTLAIGLLSTAVIFTPIGLSAKKNENVKESQQEQKVEIDPNYDFKMNIIIPNAPGFGIAGNIIALSDEFLSQLGITEFSGNEKLISVRSPVGWVHYVMNEGWTGIMAIKQPVNKTDYLSPATISTNDSSKLIVPFKYVLSDDIFAILTTDGVLFNGATCGVGGYVPLAKIVGVDSMDGATITIEQTQTISGKATFVRVSIPRINKELHIDNTGQAQLASLNQ